MSLEVRPITGDQLAEFRRVTETAFGNQPSPEDIERVRSRIEFDRTLAGFEDGAIVGAAAASSFRIRVPGGELPAAGVTMVGVLPTHRRRGVLTELMRRQLDDLHRRGEPLAALWASESPIYGRFGYGCSILHERWSIGREHTALLDALPSPGRVRLIEPAAARARYPAVFERVRTGRVGMLNMPEGRWEAVFSDEERWRGGASALFHALYEQDGRVDGYTMYRVRAEWGEGVARNELRVAEVMAATDEAYAALWRYLFGVDLVGEITVSARPVDDPLPWMLHNPRRLRRNVADALWLRLVDVPAALSRRSYASDGSLVLGVRDSFCAWNDSTYRLEGGPKGAGCERSNEPPELILDVDALAAAYLGGVRFTTLAAARRVEERAPGALARADAMFATSRAPWCPVFF